MAQFCGKFFAFVTWLLLVSAAAVAQSAADPQIVLSDECKFDAGPTGEGEHRLALLVGISDYKANIQSLPGTQQDLESMQSLLVDSNFGWGFQSENICILRNQDATLANVLKAFQHFLIERVDEDDRVVFYYAGHGAQVRDFDGAEPDGLDETLVLYDTLTQTEIPRGTVAEYVPHLTDDVLGELLRRVSAKLNYEGRDVRNNLIVVLDSCNSQSATRSNLVERSVGRESSDRLTKKARGRYASIINYLRLAGISSSEAMYDSGETIQAIAPSGAVVLSAASDGYSAYEHEGKGLFTTALVGAVASSRMGATFEEIESRTRDMMRGYNQIPSFQGAVNFSPFTNQREASEFTHRVTRASSGAIELSGPPLLGSGPGAEYRIYGNGIKEAATAVVEIVDTNILRPNATLVSGSVPPVGAPAVMIAASADSRLLRVALARDIDVQAADRIRDAQSNSADGQLGFEFVDPDGSKRSDMILSAFPAGGLVLSDATGNIRRTFDKSPRMATEVVRTLTGFARQRSLRQLQGEGGGALFDNYSVKLNLIPYTNPGPSKCISDFKPFGTVHEVAPGKWSAPVCSRWQFQVEGVDIDRELQIAVIVLSNDGGIYVLPGRQGDDARISPAGPTYTFSKVEQTFQALPPDGAPDEYLVFAVDASTPIPWWALALPSGARAASTDNSSRLFEELNRYMAFGGRNSASVVDPGDLSVWTVSKAELALAVNPDFEKNAGMQLSDQPSKREYTIQGFDIRPYLPSNTKSALYKVLQTASYLSTQSKTFVQTDETGDAEAAGQGFPYKQHNWCAADDEGNLDLTANLAQGIDCSRSIWYAFTQAGLPYAGDTIGDGPRQACLPYRAEGNDYLATADMVGQFSPLQNDFISCDGDNLQIGDVLVYRDDERGAGHTVMVIDPEKRIAWGSHGWDGNKKYTGFSDTGVEFQKIKIKKDWQRWDSPGMQLKACWRHKSFEEEGDDHVLVWKDALSFLLCNDGQRCWAGEFND